MRQFLNPNLLREELEKILGGSIYIETSCNNVELSLDSKTDTERKIYFEQILMNNEKIQLFDTQIGPDWNKYKNSYIGNIYLILKRKYSAKESIQFLATLSYKKLKQLTKDICKQEIAELDDDEKQMFLEDLGLKESGLEKLIKASYTLLGLHSYLTAGEDETRAWTIKLGTKAPQAAGKIHTDFERGFIKAEVVNYKDLLEQGSIAAAKEKGLVRMEGKEYVVKDGDVILFRFNV